MALITAVHTSKELWSGAGELHLPSVASLGGLFKPWGTFGVVETASLTLCSHLQEWDAAFKSWGLRVGTERP